MFNVFGSLKKLFQIDPFCIDNNVFRLHYKPTVIALVAFLLLVTTRQYIGDPIDCISNGIPQDVMDNYCWIYSTFMISNRLSEKVRKDIAHPGVASRVEEEDEVTYKYYQWVWVVLFFQAMLFYGPRHLWKTWEGGRISMLAFDLNFPFVNQECKEERIKFLVDYFGRNFHTHNVYAARFFICEILNFVNVLAQIYFLDFFLEGEFTTYGPEVVKFTVLDPGQREDPMARVFPKVTKCTFNMYGPSGGVQNFDGLCLLPLNMTNEKIYIIIWFWLLLLTLLSGLSLIYRLAVFIGPQVRYHLLKDKCRFSPGNDVELIAKKCPIGNWFVLYQLAKNSEPSILKEFVSGLAKRLEDEEMLEGNMIV